MNDKELDNALQNLAATPTPRSNAKRLAYHLEAIEAALAAGHQRQDILDVLKPYGINMTLGTFSSTLYRLRQKRRAPNKAKPASAATAPAPPATNADPDEALSLRERGHKVADKYMKARKNPLVEALDKKRQKP